MEIAAPGIYSDSALGTSTTASFPRPFVTRDDRNQPRLPAFFFHHSVFFPPFRDFKMLRIAVATICLLAGASIGASAQVQSGVQPLQSGVAPRQSGVAGATQQQQEAPPTPAMPEPPVRGGGGERHSSSPRATMSAPGTQTNQVR
jgi:hypothetical protein